jgi:S1-C subfamily serine protease
VRIAGMDLRLFEFDYDLTWYCFFLNADETVYGRYGGRDASDPHARISMKGLRHAMGRALEAHKTPPKPAPRPGRPVRAEDFAAAKRGSGCIHCHNVNEYRRADLKAQGRWDRDEVWVYPLPENVGLTLDVDVGDQVTVVRPASPADRAGLKPGDRLTHLAGRPVASFADASFALHKLPARGSVPIAWVRDGRGHSATLELASGWRKTNLTWRPSMLDLLPAVPFSGDDLTAEEKKQLGLAPGQAAMRQDKHVHSTLKAVGIRPGDVIVGFNGRTVDGTMEELLGHVRRNFLVGDKVTVNLLRDGRPVAVPLLLK